MTMTPRRQQRPQVKRRSASAWARYGAFALALSLPTLAPAQNTDDIASYDALVQRLDIQAHIARLRDPSPVTRAWAARSLGARLDEDRRVRGALNLALYDADPAVRDAARTALGLPVEPESSGDLANALPLTDENRAAPQASADAGASPLMNLAPLPPLADEDRPRRAAPATSTATLQADTAPGPADAAVNTGFTPPTVPKGLWLGLALLAGGFVSALAAWQFMAWFAPLRLLRLVSALRPGRRRGMARLGNAVLTPTLIRAFARQPRVARAWFAQARSEVGARLTGLTTFADREHVVPLPVVLAGERLEALNAEAVAACLAQHGALAVSGARGSGVTTTLCQAARFALDAAPHTRAARLPVFLEDHGDLLRGEDDGPLITAVAEQLAQLCRHDPLVDSALVRSLLRQGRLLVCLDRQVLRETPLGHAHESVGLLLTRPLGALRDEPPMLRCLPLRDEALTQVLNSVVERRLHRRQFNPAALRKAQRELPRMVGSAAVPVQWAKLYAERMLAEITQDFHSPAPTVPGQLVRDIVALRQRETETSEQDAAILLRHAQALAWACCAEQFSPDGISMEQAHQLLLEGENDPRIWRVALERELLLLQKCHPNLRTLGLRFRSGLIAEYLAAQHLLTSLGADETRWRREIDRLHAQPGSGAFARALRHTLTEHVSSDAATLPDWLLDALPAPAPDSDAAKVEEAATSRPNEASSQDGNRPDLTADGPGGAITETAAQRHALAARERLPQLVAELRGSDAIKRARACAELERFGPAAREVVPQLLDALKDEDLEVRRLANRTLWRIDRTARLQRRQDGQEGRVSEAAE